MLDHRLDMDGTAAKSSGRLGEFGSIETLFGQKLESEVGFLPFFRKKKSG